MNPGHALALACALVAALGYGTASIAQAEGARRATDTLRALRHPLYLAGLGGDALAWLASLVALRALAVYQVQAILAGSLAVTVVGARIVLAARVRRRDVAAIAVTVLALTVVAAAAGPQEQVHPSTPLRYGLVAAAVLVAAAGWLTVRATGVPAPAAAPPAAAPGTRPDEATPIPPAAPTATPPPRAPAPAARPARGPAWLPAVAAALAGLAYGGTAVCARALPTPAGGLPAVIGALATDPLTWALAGFGSTGTLLYAYALQHGQVGPVTAVLWIAEVIAPSIVGVAVLSDTVRAGWTPYAVCAVLATTAAAVVLATAPATAAATADTVEGEQRATVSDGDRTIGY